MKKLRSLIGCLLAAAVLLALAACGQQAGTTSQSQAGGQSQTASTPNSGAQSPAVSQTQEEPTGSSSSGGEDQSSGGGGTLVVYFSATGNTEAVAGYIAQALNADTFVITPAQPYTEDDLNWTNESSRVSREYADESLRDVELTTTEVENWDSYDTVFIGYPIWWGIAAWPVDGFVEANDFTGKTVIPFCTSSSSGLGESGELLAELAGTGDWQEGQRFRSSAGQADVDEWVDSLGLSAE